MSLTYSKEVTVSLSEKSVSLLFANPSKSNQDVVLLLQIEDAVLFRSGRLTPGNRVTALPLAEGVESRLMPGGYEGKFIVLYYDSVSGEKAVVQTEIPVRVTVAD